MDPLSDVLRVVRLDGAYFWGVDATEPWSVEVLAARQLSPRVLPEADHLISYHIVTSGRCFGGLVGEEQVELVAGDVLVFPHGDPHVMSSGVGLRLADDFRDAAPPAYPFTLHLGTPGAATASLVCGFLGCDLEPFNPLLAALPRRMHLRGMSDPWIGNSIHKLTEEARLGRVGAQSVLTRLAEMMFIEVVRRYLDELPPEQAGWLAALRDGMVGRALALLHARPAHPWTLGELARDVSASRSSLARRFTQLMGQPPMQYLTQWRMQVAGTLLTQGGAKLAAIALEVGYDSEAAFSRAFKKATGSSPGAWRTHRHSLRRA